MQFYSGAWARPYPVTREGAADAIVAQAVGGMFGLYFRSTPPQSYAEVMQCDKEAFNRFFHAVLERGVYLAPSAYEAGFVSSAHGDADLAHAALDVVQVETPVTRARPRLDVQEETCAEK